VRWASSASQHADLDRALGEAVEGLRERLRGDAPSLLAMFASIHHHESWAELGDRVRDEFPGALLFGCGAQSVIGAGCEIEDGPGLSLTGAFLPGVTLHPFHVDAGLDEPSLRDLDLPDRGDLLLLSDPFVEHTEALLRELDARLPGASKIGGVASGGQEPEANLLFLGDEVHRSGTIGIALDGAIRVQSVVAQGCRPIGHPLFVTRAEGNVLHEVDEGPPVEVLNALFERAEDARERALFQSSLFLGVAMGSGKSEYGQGDYLVRNLIGGDQESGALHVAAELQSRQIVQFHLRDAHTADMDLLEHLDDYVERCGMPSGALLFSCLGRGKGLYGIPDHDCDMLREQIGPIPIGGFFGNGEIGPVGDRTFLHGYTSAFAFFHETREGGGHPSPRLW